jgi:hypothetical protein
MGHGLVENQRESKAKGSKAKGSKVKESKARQCQKIRKLEETNS